MLPSLVPECPETSAEVLRKCHGLGRTPVAQATIGWRFMTDDAHIRLTCLSLAVHA